MMLELTADALQTALTRYEDLFSKGDVEAILDGFAEDVRVRYASIPPFQGKDKLRELLRGRFDRMRDYKLSKRLEFIAAPRFAASWTGTYLDVRSGEGMEIFGMEILTLRDGKFCEWSAAVTVWPLAPRETA